MIYFDFLDMGQGDGTLITDVTDNKTTCVLVDFGSSKNWKSKKSPDVGHNAEAIALSRLKDSGYYISLLIVTHRDKDHINRLNSFIVNNGINVRNVIMGGASGAHDAKYKAVINGVSAGNMFGVPTAPVFRHFGSALDSNKWPVRICLAPTVTFDPPDSMKPSFWLDVLSSDYSSGKDVNDDSIVLTANKRLRNGDVARVMLTGDASQIVENAIINKRDGVDNKGKIHEDQMLRSICLKLGHHGSEHSTGERWAAAVDCYIAIATADIYFGHPRAEVIKKLLTHSPRFKDNTLLMAAGDGNNTYHFAHSVVYGQFGMQYRNAVTTSGIFSNMIAHHHRVGEALPNAAFDSNQFYDVGTFSSLGNVAMNGITPLWSDPKYALPALDPGVTLGGTISLIIDDNSLSAQLSMWVTYKGDQSMELLSEPFYPGNNSGPKSEAIRPIAARAKLPAKTTQYKRGAAKKSVLLRDLSETEKRRKIQAMKRDERARLRAEQRELLNESEEYDWGGEARVQQDAPPMLRRSKRIAHMNDCLRLKKKPQSQ